MSHHHHHHKDGTILYHEHDGPLHHKHGPVIYEKRTNDLRYGWGHQDVEVE